MAKVHVCRIYADSLLLLVVFSLSLFWEIRTGGFRSKHFQMSAKTLFVKMWHRLTPTLRNQRNSERGKAFLVWWKQKGSKERQANVYLTTCLSLLLRALFFPSTLNVQIIEDSCVKNKDKFRVSALLLILFTPFLIGRLFSSTPLWIHTTFQPC